MKVMNKILVGLLLVVAAVYGQQPSADTLSMTATPPSGVQSLSVGQVGVTGGSSYCYWVVAVFAGGMDAQPKASCTGGSNATLSGSNYNVINWTPASSATGYWVVRTVGNSFPGSGTVAVNSTVLAATVTTLNDQSNTLNSFTWTPMATVNATFRLLNTGSFVFPNVVGDTAYNIVYFANLPPAASKKGILYIVYDSSSTTTCSGGGGSGTPSLCLSNGVTWIPMAAAVSGGTTTIQTNGVNNSSQNPVNFTNSAVFNGLTLTQTNTSGGIVQLGVTGSLNLAGLTPISADNVVGNFTGSSAVPSTQLIPSCANDGSHALVYVGHTLTCATITVGGSGTVTSFSAGTLSPLFTTSVATSTTTPALSFALSNFGADNIFGNFTGGSATPSTQAIPSCANDGSHALSYPSHTLTCSTITTSASAPTFPVNAQTTTYTATTTDFSNCKTISTASASFTVTLVASGSQPANGQCIWVQNYGTTTGNVTVATNGQNLNGGPSSVKVPPSSQMYIVSNGTNYFGTIFSLSLVPITFSSTGSAGVANVTYLITDCLTTLCSAGGGTIQTPATYSISTGWNIMSGVYNAPISGLTNNTIVKASGTTGVVNSGVTDDGTTVTTTEAVNFGGSSHTRPFRIGTASSITGSTCTQGEMGFATDATAGQNAYFCTATNTWTQQLNSGGSGGSVFTGSTATAPSFTATPTFSLADVSVKSPVRVEPGTLTANITSVTFTNKTAGAKFSIAWTQDGTGGRVVNYGASAGNTCTIDPTINVTTTQFFEVAADGSTVNGVGCTTNHSGVTGGPTSAAPGTPGASQFFTWVDSTNGVFSSMANSSATVSNTVVPSTCGGSTFVQGVSAAGVLACATPSGSGNVSNVGTPLIHQVGVWATATTIGGITVGTNNQVLKGNTGADPGFAALVSGDLPSSAVQNNQVNTFTSAGTLDLSAISVTAGLKPPQSAGAAPTTTSILAYDTTLNQYVYGISGVTVRIPVELNQGTATLGTSAISGNSCATAVTVTAANVLTTDTISWTPNADISGVTGYGVASTDGLKIYPYPTSGNVNFKVCNGTGTSITPGAVTLNWRVSR